MKHVGIIPFVGFALAFVYILNAGMRAAAKRRAFRLTVILSALSLPIVMLLDGVEVELLIFVLPVLAVVTFIFIRYTKFCERCGTAVQTNQPFVDKGRCPECGTALK
jgi:hypothetical protein